MGYSYTSSGLLCCDNCGASGGVRKRRCPFGYCPSAALCADCNRRYPQIRALHRASGCEKAHLEFEQRERYVRHLLAQGEVVRCSALGVGDGRVHVLFRRADGSTEGRFMAQETYRAVRIMEPATPADFAAFGPLEAAPSDFGSGRTSKRVDLQPVDVGPQPAVMLAGDGLAWTD